MSTQRSILTKSQANRAVFGYIRYECVTINITIPNALVELIVIWYHQKYAILAFNHNYCSKLSLGRESFKFEEDRKSIIKLNDGHAYILSDIEPLFCGVHCFRAHTMVVDNGWVSWGVSEKENIGNDSWSSENSWHIAYNHWSNGCYSNGCDSNGHQTHTVHGTDIVMLAFLRFDGLHEIDILLDCDNGTLNIQLIGTKCEEPYPEIKCWNMPCKNNNYKDNHKFKGYVPHFNISGKGTTMRLAKIPIECYGTRQLHNIFQKM